MSDLVIGEDGLARPLWASTDPMLRDYYDTEWGMPVRDERGVFERLSLEAFQSGLSWRTILAKRPAFRAAFADFDPDVVAAFGEDDVARLMADAGIVRNRAKIAATITNAGATVALRDDGGLADLVWSFRPAVTPEPASFAEVPTTSAESVALSKALRKRGSPSSVRPRCTPSWRRSASSTRTCSAATAGGPPASGPDQGRPRPPRTDREPRG